MPRFTIPDRCAFGGFTTTLVCGHSPGRCPTVPRPLTCGTADCARPECQRRYRDRRLERFLDHLDPLGDADIAVLVGTTPPELWPLIGFERASKLRSRLTRIVEGVVRRRLQLGEGERLFIAAVLHPAGDAQPRRWFPHFDVFVAGSVLTITGFARLLDLRLLEDPEVEREIRRKWGAALAKETGTLPRLPQVTVTVHEHEKVPWVLRHELRAFPGWKLGQHSHICWAGAWANSTWPKIRERLGWTPHEHSPGTCRRCGSFVADFVASPRECRQEALVAHGRKGFSPEEIAFHEQALATGLDDFATLPEGDDEVALRDLPASGEVEHSAPDTALPHVKSDSWCLTVDLRGVPLYDPTPAGRFAHMLRMKAAERSAFTARALARDVQMVSHLARVPRWGDAASAVLATARAELRELRAHALTEAHRTRRLAAFRSADLLDAVLTEDFGAALSARPIAGLGYYLPSAALSQIRAPLAEFIRGCRPSIETVSTATQE